MEKEESILDENKNGFSVGLKELIGNFTPAYIILLLGLFLINQLKDLITATSLLFLAGIIAIAMSAIQPYILKIIVRPNKFLKHYTDSSVKEVLQKFTHKNKKEKIDIDATTQNFNISYLSYLKSSVDKFWEKREKLQGLEKRFYETKEARLFLFLYLFIFFLILTGGSIYQNVTGNIIFLKVYDISKEISNIESYSILVFIILFLIFLFGYQNESVRYRERIYEEIPVLAIANPKNNITSVENKITFLEKNKDNMNNSVYLELKTEIEHEIYRLQKLNFEKNWVHFKVHEKTKIGMKDIQQISEDISRSTLEESVVNAVLRAFILLTIIMGGPFISYFFLDLNPFILIILVGVSIVTLIGITIYIMKSKRAY